jgi:uncharacterized protein (TIGR02246 family)
MRIAIAALLLTASLFAHAQTAPEAMPSVQLPPELDRVLRDYETAWTAKDAAALSKLFTEDGFILQNGKPPLRGREAIRVAYAEASGGPLALRALAYSVSEDTGYIIGAFAGAKDKPDSGKFILAVKRGKDGKWLIAADMDNMNSRPTRQVAPAPPTQ